MPEFENLPVTADCRLPPSPNRCHPDSHTYTHTHTHPLPPGPTGLVTPTNRRAVESPAAANLLPPLVCSASLTSAVPTEGQTRGWGGEEHQGKVYVANTLR